MSANPSLNDVDIDFLHDISSRFAAEDPLHQDLERIVEFASAVVRCDSCFIYIREGDDLVLRASKNPHGEEVGRLKLALGQGITGWVSEHREPVAVSQHAWQDARFRTFQELPEDSYEAFLSVPILSRGRVVGVINLQHRAPHTYTARQIRLMSMIGFLVGAEIEMARLEVENSQLLQKLETRKLMELRERNLAAGPGARRGAGVSHIAAAGAAEAQNVKRNCRGCSVGRRDTEGVEDELKALRRPFKDAFRLGSCPPLSGANAL